MAKRFESFSGRGPVYMRQRGASEGALPVINCSSLEFSIDENRISQLDYTSPSGGEASSVSEVSSVTASITVLDVMNPRNLAIALRGGTSNIAGGTSVTGEAHTGYPGALVAFDRIPDISDASNTITVTVDPGGTATPAVEGTDYTVTRAGIIVLDDATNITSGSDLEVDYDEAPQSIVEALTEPEAEYELIFNGLNRAASGRAVVVKAFRLSISPASALALISGEYGELPLEARVLNDPERAGTGTSGFFQVLKEEEAA